MARGRRSRRSKRTNASALQPIHRLLNAKQVHKGGKLLREMQARSYKAFTLHGEPFTLHLGATLLDLDALLLELTLLLQDRILPSNELVHDLNVLWTISELATRIINGEPGAIAKAVLQVRLVLLPRLHQ